MRVALCQIAPVLLDRARTLDRVLAALDQLDGAQLAVFGEALVPGYPIWLDRTGGARFNDPEQKRWHARYLEQAVDLERGDLASVQERVAALGIHAVLGVVERAPDRSGHTLYCTCVTLGPDGRVLSSHRKLMPTYEERLAWGTGDGAGLVVHPVGPFRLGSLNCWENWMPLARHALQAQGETLHAAIWPGSVRNTEEWTRFAAREGRSFVLSVGAPLRACDVPSDLEGRADLGLDADAWIHDGGSCVAAPDGTWLLEPRGCCEGVFTVDLDPEAVLRERQNFDPAGHYARPDVLHLSVDRRRQATTSFVDPEPEAPLDLP